MPVHPAPVILPAGGPQREAPRPPELRDEHYAARFDHDTLFYDVYRIGRDVVFQGPPLFNLARPLQDSSLLPQGLGRFWPFGRRARRIERKKGSEIWLRDARDELVIDGPLGPLAVTVQPDLAELFAGRRVIHTLSKDNDPRWIRDWIAFYQRQHGADGVLLYDNASTHYGAAELEADLRGAFPDLAITVVAWPFKYGPQGGLAGAVNGVEAPWDSDYCQTGSLQHARLRFLRHARSVLNVDIDELVIGPESIFAATEASRTGFIKFAGQWVTSATPQPVTAQTCRHGDFLHRDCQETEICPPKWCIAPGRCESDRYTWSVHNLFGAKANRTVDPTFSYRHFKGISNNWKYDRWDAGQFDPVRFVIDLPLHDALAGAGLIDKLDETAFPGA